MAEPEGQKPKAVGGDLIIPALALAFTSYFFLDIHGLAWEARANGTVIGGVLLALIAVLLVRIGLQLRRGTAVLRLSGRLREPRQANLQRLAIIAIMVGFVLLLPYLGITIGLFLVLVLSMTVLEARRGPGFYLAAIATPLVVYFGFVVFLHTRLPKGPFEALMHHLFGIGG
ncbi:MAG: hypothetical protein OHK0024_02200 [Thalassobaculales bacterium]